MSVIEIISKWSRCIIPIQEMEYVIRVVTDMQTLLVFIVRRLGMTCLARFVL